MRRTWVAAVACLLTVLSSYAGVLGAEGKSRLSMKAQDIRYNDQTETFVIRGKVYLRLENLVITADEGEINTRDNTARLKGNVRLVRTRKGNPEEGTVLETGEMEIKTKTRDFAATGGVVITQNDRRFEAVEAQYTDGPGTLILRGKVRITKTDESLTAEEAVLNTETDEFTATAVEAEIMI